MAELVDRTGFSEDEIWALTADLDLLSEYEVSDGLYSSELLDLLVRQAQAPRSRDESS